MKNFVPVSLAVIRHSNGKFLLTQRHAPEYPEVHLKWQLVGGGIDFGESSDDTVKRECVEELGVHVEIVIPYPVVKTHVWHHTNEEPSHALLITYLCKLRDESKPIVLNEESHSYGWFTLEKMKKLDLLPNATEFVEELVALWERVGRK